MPRPWILPREPTTREQLLATGVTDAMIRTQCRSGHLISIRNGVYLAGSAWPEDPAGQHLVRAYAEQVVNPESILSHQSAAVSWNLPTPGFTPWHDLPVAITMPASGHSSRSGRAVHHLGTIPTGQISHDGAGHSVTSPARTAVDLAADLPLPEQLVILDGAGRLICRSLSASIRRRDYGNPRMVSAVAALLTEATVTTRAARLRSPIALANPSRESAAESLSAGYFELAGLPRPEFQHEIRSSRGSLFPDCYWEDHGLIGECDGAIKYADANAYVLEKEREQWLRDLDFRIVRWQAKEIMLQPQRVVERVARSLGL